MPMTSTNGSIITPYSPRKRPHLRRIAPLLRLTNVAPIVLVDLTPADLVDIETLSRLPRSGEFIVCGLFKPPGARLLEPEGLDWNRD